MSSHPASLIVAALLGCMAWAGAGCGGGSKGNASSAGQGGTSSTASTSAAMNGGSTASGPSCTAGTRTCNGQEVQVCGTDGTVKTMLTCPAGTTCTEGACDDLRCNDELQQNGEFSLPLKGWPRYRHDNRNSGFTNAVVADAPALKWKTFIGGTNYDMQQGLASGAVVDQNGTIYVGAGELDMHNGQLYAFSAAGQMLYAFPANRLDGLSTPAVRSDGTAYVASGDATLWAITPMGQKGWSYQTGMASDGDPIVTREGTLVYPSDDESLYALTPQGQLVWKSDPTTGPGEADAGLAQSCDGRILAGGRNGWYSLDVKTGAKIWGVPATGMYEGVSSSPVVTADGTMYGVDGGGMGYAIDPTGNVLWSRQIGPAGATAPLHAGTMLYVVLNDGQLHALDAGTGMEVWARPVGYALTRDVGQIAGPVIDGNLRIYVNSTDGNLYCFDTDGTQRFKLPLSGVARPQLFSGTLAIGSDGTLLAPGNDGNLYVLR